MSAKQCEHPELQPKDGECSTEQIEKCHGSQKSHSCDKND